LIFKRVQSFEALNTQINLPINGFEILFLLAGKSNMMKMRQRAALAAL
jgi:hypothetical protein